MTMQFLKFRHAMAVVFFVISASSAPAASASAALALEHGCFSCHGELSRGGSPTFVQLSRHLAKYKGQTGAAARKGEKLKTDDESQDITPHRMLSSEKATLLLQWLIDGVAP